MDPTGQLENFNFDWRTTKVNADGTQEGEIIREEWRCPHCNQMDIVDRFPNMWHLPTGLATQVGAILSN
eukprot:COSAG01_NODE_40554_length_462_cov_0.870523_1_plen_68_part_01